MPRFTQHAERASASQFLQGLNLAVLASKADEAARNAERALQARTLEAMKLATQIASVEHQAVEASANTLNSNISTSVTNTESNAIEKHSSAAHHGFEKSVHAALKTGLFAQGTGSKLATADLDNAPDNDASAAAPAA